MLSKIACIAVATTAADALAFVPMTAGAYAMSKHVELSENCQNLNSEQACQDAADCHWNQFPREPIPESKLQSAWGNNDLVRSLISQTGSHCADGPDFLSTAKDLHTCMGDAEYSQVYAKGCNVKEYSEAYEYLMKRAPEFVNGMDWHWKSTHTNHLEVCKRLAGCEDVDCNKKCWVFANDWGFQSGNPDSRSRWIEGHYYELAKKIATKTERR